MLAVCLQHEMDHLDGKLFVDYLSRDEAAAHPQEARQGTSRSRRRRCLAAARRALQQRSAPQRRPSLPHDRLRIVFAGTPAFALPALRALAGAHDVVGVLTQPDRPAGRGRALTASAVKQRALALGVPVLQPARARAAMRRRWQCDTARSSTRMAAGCAGGRGLRTASCRTPCCELPRLGCLNIHASLLPRWRGAAPIQRAILAGDALTGVAIMQMDEGLDTGDVLLERAVADRAASHRGELHDQLAALGAAPSLRDARGHGSRHAACRVRRTRRRASRTRPSSTRPRRASTGRAGASGIDRRIRAFNPWPVAEHHVRRRAGQAAAQPRAAARSGSVAPAGHGAGTRGRCARGRLRRGRRAGIGELQRAGRQAGRRARLRQRRARTGAACGS